MRRFGAIWRHYVWLFAIGDEPYPRFMIWQFSFRGFILLLYFFFFFLTVQLEKHSNASAERTRNGTKGLVWLVPNGDGPYVNTPYDPIWAHREMREMRPGSAPCRGHAPDSAHSANARRQGPQHSLNGPTTIAPEPKQPLTHNRAHAIMCDRRRNHAPSAFFDITESPHAKRKLRIAPAHFPDHGRTGA